MLNKFLQLMAEFDFAHKKIAVALSGGCDSLALATLCNEWAKKNGKEVVAITVDHSLRKSSAAETLQVKAWCHNLGIAHSIIKNPDTEKPTKNIQEYARNIRYKLLTDWCTQNDIHDLFVAHHAEDQAETFLLRLERGSGVDGLSSMQKISYKENIRILRPLLNIHKNDLKQYLTSINQEWIEDPSNKNSVFKRNKLRSSLSEISEDMDILTTRINNSVDALQQAKDALEFYTYQHIKYCAQVFEEGYALVDLKSFSNAPEDIQKRALKKIVCCIGGKKRVGRFEELKRLYSNLLDYENFNGCTLWGCKISLSKYSKIRVEREYSAITSDVIIKAGNSIEWDNRYLVALDNKSTIRSLYIGVLSSTDIKEFLSLTLSEFEKHNIESRFHVDTLSTVPIFSQTKLLDIKDIIAIPHFNYFRHDILKRYLSCKFSPLNGSNEKTIGYCPEEKFAIT